MCLVIETSLDFCFKIYCLFLIRVNDFDVGIGGGNWPWEFCNFISFFTSKDMAVKFFS